MNSARPVRAASKAFPWIVPLLALAAVAAFGRSLALPFIQDDWGVLRFVQTTPALQALGSFFVHGSAVLYRPFGQAYLLGMYQLFGANPLAFHIAGLAIHIANSWLVATLFGALTRDPLIGTLTGLLYAVAVAVHLDSLSWAVGIYDLAGTGLFLLSVRAFLGNRPIASAAAYLSGCLFKESIIIEPVILLCLPLLEARTDWQRIARERWALYVPTVIAGLVVVLIKLGGVSPLSLPADHPYAIRLVGLHVIHNALDYYGYLLQAFFPFFAITEHRLQIIVGIVTAATVGGLIRLARQGLSNTTRNAIVFFVIWMIAALLPVVFLPNHLFRYYATLALPAFIALVLLVWRDILTSMRQGSEVVVTTLSVACALAVCASIVQANRIYAQGLNQATLVDGTNHLITRAATVDIVRRGLLQQPPTTTVIVIDGADIWSFDKDAGPRSWLDNDCVRVYSLADLRYRDGTFRIEAVRENQTDTGVQMQGREVVLAPAQISAYRLAGGQLDTLTLTAATASSDTLAVTAP